MSDTEFKIEVIDTSDEYDIGDISFSGGVFYDSIEFPEYVDPEDPIEIAQYKLAGVCPACKSNNSHKFGCPRYFPYFSFDVSDSNNTITLSDDVDILTPNTDTCIPVDVNHFFYSMNDCSTFTVTDDCETIAIGDIKLDKW